MSIKSRAQLLRLFTELHKTGTSVVIATHDPAMDQFDGARRLVLGDGASILIEAGVSFFRTGAPRARPDQMDSVINKDFAQNQRVAHVWNRKSRTLPGHAQAAAKRAAGEFARHHRAASNAA